MSGLSVPHFKKKKDIILKPTVDYEIPFWLVVALNKIGIKEIPGPGSNTEIDEFLKSVGMPSDDDIAWCAAAHNFILVEGGVKGTGKPNAQSYLNWGIKLEKPRLGCTVIFKRGSEPWMGHVGFFLDMYKAWISLVGGNQRNRYGVNKYKEADVLGYRWPKVV